MDPQHLITKTVLADEFPEQIISNITARRSVEAFLRPHAIERLIQALVCSISTESTAVVLGSDGSFGSKEAIQRTIRVLAANSVRRVVVDHSMPISSAASLMRERHCRLGLFFTAGHHSAASGNKLFGIKILKPPGSPLSANTLGKINKHIRILSSYQYCANLYVDISVTGNYEYIVSDKSFAVQVVDSVAAYLNEIREMFHFKDIKDYVGLPETKILIDCSNGVTGPYVKKIFVEELGMSSKSVLNENSLEDFGGCTTELNATTCSEFLQLVKNNHTFCAIISPDGCRCMIVGEDGFVVSTSDSLAVIADKSNCIRVFQDTPLQAVFRSICTSQALDKIAKNVSVSCFEVLPGWEHFSRAMVPLENSSTLFGGENFGIGACSQNFSGDRDGVWTVLAWLSIMSKTRKSVRQIVEDFWSKYGRNVFGRLDFKNLTPASIDVFMTRLRDTYTLRFRKIKSGSVGDPQYLDPFGLNPKLDTTAAKKNKVDVTFDISNYVHPYGFIKKSLLRNDTYQIYEIQISDTARLIIRRSSHNLTTLRFYVEVCIDSSDEKIFKERDEILKPYTVAALKITKIQEFFEEQLSPVLV